MAGRSAEALVRLHHDRVLAIRAQIAVLVAAAWDRLGGASEAELAAFTATVAPLVRGAQRATITTVDAYLAAMVAGVTGQPFTAYGVDAEALIDALRAGVPTAEVYARPSITMRRLLSEGRSVAQASAAARSRAVSAAETDVMLAQRAGTDDVLARDTRIVGYRRVLTARSCAFCATASTQRYGSGDLMALHSHCDCGVAPIIGDRDPGHVLNRTLLGDLKEAGGSRYWNDRGFGVDEDGVIRRRRDVPVLDDEGNPVLTAAGKPARRMELGDPLNIAVREHGELGPVLTDGADHFTGSADLG